MKRNIVLIGLLGIGIIGGFFLIRSLTMDNGFSLPRGGETKEETITIRDGEVVENGDIEDMRGGESTETGEATATTRNIMVTVDEDGNEIRHSIPVNEILQGCPSRDCIPSIDDPTFVSPADASSWLEDSEPGIAFSQGGVSRFYPFQILVRHEIVNDTFPVSEQDSTLKRVLISYCPLCLTAVVFDPSVQGQESEFGVSGLLWESNLIMYDRNTENLWSQVLGEAVVGDLTGTTLKKLPSDQMFFGKWKEANPNGQVLDRAGRGYGSYPYADSYFDLPSTSVHFAQPTDTRLPFDAFVFGVLEKGKAKAYNVDTVKEKGEVVDTFNGATFRLVYLPELDVVRMFRVMEDGSEERENPLSGFWFSWSEAHPDTEVFK